MKRELLQTEAQRKLSGRIAMLLTAGLSFASPAIAQEEIDISIVSGFSPAVAAVKMLKESFTLSTWWVTRDLWGFHLYSII